MKAHITEMFHYNEWANNRIFNFLAEIENPPAKVFSLISHVIAAQRIWLGRIKQENVSHINVWEEHPLDELKFLSSESTKNWLNYMDSIEDNTLTRLVMYKNIKGDLFENNLRELLPHVINHGTHHRSQILLLFRQNGITPPQLDYIFYVRNKKKNIGLN